MTSGQTLHITYGGHQLPPQTTVHWKVMAWDGAGRPTAWSRPARWTTGLLDPAGWRARWIGLRPAAEGGLRPATWLRREFRVDGPVAQAIVHATAAGIYELRLNGERVGDDVFAPGWSEYGKRLFYQTYDVTAQIRAHGANALGAIVADGWYGLHHGGRGRTRLRAELLVRYEDGREERVATDETWRATDEGPIRSADFYQGEEYDARREMEGWDLPGFAADDWRPVRVGRLDRDTWVDVAARLREAVAKGADEVAVSTETFGDPAPGARRRLVVSWRQDGRDGRLEVPEGETLRLLRSEDEAPAKLTIVRARYGARDTWTDVTAKLRAAVRGEALRIRATNEAFGDPIYGTVKELVVEYRIGERAATARAAEGAELALGSRRFALVRPGLTVVEARFGADVRDAIADAVLEAHPGVPVRRQREIRPVLVDQPKPGVWVFHMGENWSGWARLKVRGREGSTVVLRFAEMLEPDGTVYTRNLRGARSTDSYTLSGHGEEVWEPRFTFHGFQYVEVTGLDEPPDLDTITGVVLHSDAPLVSTFECSSPLLERLWRNIRRGQLGNYLEVPTDCPQRDERLGWTGDAQVFIRTGTYHQDVAAFFTAWMRTVNDAQNAEGGYPNFAPRGGGVSPGWGDAGVICPWVLHTVYGDTRVIEAHFESVKEWIEHLRERSEGLIRPAEGFGDWLNVDDPMPKEVIATAYFARSTDLLARMARATGRHAEAARLDGLHLSDSGHEALARAVEGLLEIEAGYGDGDGDGSMR